VLTSQAIFVAFFGLVALWFAVAVFRTQSMVRSALALLFCMAALGAMFLAMETEFLGVLQIMMMATEMAIMAIFMVMYSTVVICDGRGVLLPSKGRNREE